VTPFRLLAVDLDGTLLDPHGKISARTHQAIAAARDTGTIVTLATSRRFTGAFPVARALGCIAALILYDGAQVRTYPDGDVLLTQSLGADVAQQSAEVMAAHSLQPIAQHGDAAGEQLLVSPRPARAPWADAYLATAAHQVEHVPLAELCAGRPDPLRVVAFGPLRRVRQAAGAVTAAIPVSENILSQVVAATQILPQGNYGTSELTVFAPGASKGTALTRLAELLDVPLTQTLAIGDGLNDRSMLRVAGIGVAMANAPATVRRTADAITASNLEDGAAQAIERYVLGWNSSRGGATPLARSEHSQAVELPPPR
jgi:5-amino-6-(5-phospho-D-ribitylamino)uracil phosphatase